MRIMMEGLQKYLLCLYINSAVEKLKFKSVHLHQRNTVDGKPVFRPVVG